MKQASQEVGAVQQGKRLGRSQGGTSPYGHLSPAWEREAGVEGRDDLVNAGRVSGVLAGVEELRTIYLQQVCSGAGVKCTLHSHCSPTPY